MNVLLIDDWAGNVISDYKPMIDGGVAGSINRLGQGDAYNNSGEKDGKGDYLYKAHHDGAKAHDLLTETYWVIDPSIAWQRQLDWVIANWPNQDDLPFSVDVELTGGKTGPQIVQCVQSFLAAFEAHFGERPIIYTGKLWFWEVQIRDANRLMPLWQVNYDFWLAQYPLKKDPRITCTWQQLKAYYPSGWTPAIDPPRAGMTMRKPAIWQWSGDKFILPGVSGPIDLNFATQAWIDKNRKTQPPALTLTLEQKVDVLWQEHLLKAANG